MAEIWTTEELAASVDAYIEMLVLEKQRKAYSKKQVYRDLAAKFKRSEKAFEYRMQNISAVLNEMKEPWIPGLKPAGNVGANIKPRIVALLRKDLNHAAAAPQSDQAAYKVKLPAMRTWLIQVARSKGKVTYGDMMNVFDIDRFSLRFALSFLGHQAANFDEPIITALVVNKATQMCSVGLESEFGVKNDEAERKRLYDYWSKTDHVEPPEATGIDKSLKQRAIRFASVEARPEQAMFRRLVFEACKGKCVITGCDVPQALDAAHLHGRDWRKGHNTAKDGVLLRKDLHALYDAKLLLGDWDNKLSCEVPYYKELHGKKLKPGVQL